ncbi:hypothetical protein GWC92_04600 [Aeromonas caviae]|uniref:hypothetical protein n=1 Tax=Aeromonas caviae TaxID=648 RepID=UPI000DD988B7|nr:hypothetical protein [Aeromonas caviae]AXB01441.1 hypothetical protein C1C92_11020 [Aeromonas caviae]QLL79664.1 hypothetical protein GWC92_04600 [Aeromonas caviae]
MSTERLEALMGQFIEQLADKLGETNTLLTEIRDELTEIKEELDWLNDTSAVNHLSGKLTEIKEELDWLNETSAVSHLAGKLDNIESAVSNVELETGNIYTHMLTK